jgi:hypothetical protein
VAVGEPHAQTKGTEEEETPSILPGIETWNFSNPARSPLVRRTDLPCLVYLNLVIK